MRLTSLCLGALLAMFAACAKPATQPGPVEPQPAKASPQVQEAVAPIALVLVMDRSGSMSGSKLEQARAAAKASLGTLSPESLFGLVSFDQEPATVVPLEAVSKPRFIEGLIEAITAGGGTDIREGLREAHGLLREAESNNKHIILFTDGYSPYEGMTELAENIRKDGITISCVGIGNFDIKLLQLIAEAGEGRIHVAKTPEELPPLFVLETKSALGR